jgi:hypothetical protein
VLQFTPRFIPNWIKLRAQIVPEAVLQGCLFLLLPPLENFFPSTVVHIRRRHIADPFAIAPVVIELDELRHGRLQSLRAGEQQIQPGLERVVELLQLVRASETGALFSDSTRLRLP